MVIIAVGSAYDERDKYKSTFARDAELVAGSAGRGRLVQGQEGSWNRVATEMDGAMVCISIHRAPRAALHQSAQPERVQRLQQRYAGPNRGVHGDRASWHSATTAQLPASVAHRILVSRIVSSPAC